MKQFGPPPLSKRTFPFSTNPQFLSSFFLTSLFVQFSKTRYPTPFLILGGEETMFACIRINVSCTFYSHTPIKSKSGGKILFQKHVKTSFFLPIFNLVKFSLRPKNECVALIAFKLSVALNTLENGGQDLSTCLIREDNLVDWSLKHSLSTDS